MSQKDRGEVIMCDEGMLIGRYHRAILNKDRLRVVWAAPVCLGLAIFKRASLDVRASQASNRTSVSCMQSHS